MITVMRADDFGLHLSMQHLAKIIIGLVMDDVNQFPKKIKRITLNQ